MHSYSKRFFLTTNIHIISKSIIIFENNIFTKLISKSPQNQIFQTEHFFLRISI